MQLYLTGGLTTTLCCPQRTEHQPDIPSVPSAGEYVLEGTKITLDLLTKVASLIPLPYVTLAVEAVSTLISIGEVHFH